MRRLVRALLLLPLAACSWITDFAVSNRSEVPIRVELHSPYDDPKTCRIWLQFSLALAPSTSLDGWRPRPEWTPLPLEEVHVDRERCSLALELPPATALRIARGTNYSGPESGRSGELADLELVLTTKSGKLAFAGLELVRAFEKRNRGLYELAYRAPDFAS